MEHEGRHREIMVLLREVLDQVAGQQREVASGGDLFGVREAGRVAEGGAAHAERPRLLGHHLGELLLVALGQHLAERAGGVVGGFGDEAQHRLLDGQVAAGRQVQLGRLHRGGMFGDRDRLVERDAVLAQRVEGEIERHQLGEAGREALQVRVGLLQHGAAVGVHDDGAELAAILGVRRHRQDRENRQAAKKPTSEFGGMGSKGEPAAPRCVQGHDVAPGLAVRRHRPLHASAGDTMALETFRPD